MLVKLRNQVTISEPYPHNLGQVNQCNTNELATSWGRHEISYAELLKYETAHK